MNWSTVSDFNTLEWSASRAYCPICQTGDHCQDTQYQRYGSHRRYVTNAPIPTMEQRDMLLRTPSPISLGKGVIYWDFSWNISLDGWLTSYPWMRENCKSPLGFYCPVANPDLLKYSTPRMEHALLTKGRRWGPGLSCPVLSPSPYVWQYCFPQPTCMVCAAKLYS